MQITESFPFWISTKYVEWFMAYMENSMYGLTQIRFYYGSIRLKMRIVQYILKEVCHTEFQQNPWLCLWHSWNSWKGPLGKLGFIMYQYGLKFKLPNSIYEMAYGIPGKVHLCKLDFIMDQYGWTQLNWTTFSVVSHIKF